MPRPLSGATRVDSAPSDPGQVTSPHDPSATAWRREVDALFDQALDLAPDDRAALLARAAERDPELRREVEALLAAAGRQGVTADIAGVVASAMAPDPGAPDPAPLMPQYEVLEQVGAGGMGVVYKARDPRLRRFVALKFLSASLGADPQLKQRFLQEARTIAALDHPNVCSIFEVAEPAAGQLVIVMPWYEGETLKQRVARGPLPVAEALDYALQVAAALAHAHAAGVVHRDIKPANVIVNAGGRVRVLDFGIAKVIDANAHVTLTQAGAVLGTLAYMSPEQAAGEPVDHRTDLWALGAVLYEMLAGRPPFSAETMVALFHAIHFRDPDRLSSLRPELPAGLHALVHRLLEKDPARRHSDALALAADLEAVRQGRAPAAPAAPGDDSLARGRAAFARHAWREAYDALSAADAAAGLDAEDLERLGEAAWWLSDGAASVRARERAYRRYAERGAARGAASMALALAEDHLHRLARSVAQGWLRRAERHLSGLSDVPELGWMHRLKFVIALGEGRPEEAMEHADRALAVARRVGDSDLEALALQDYGRALVARGLVKEGMALIDEAMTAAATGELTPRTTGRAYCNMLDVCERLGDVGRVAEWYDAAKAWYEPHTDSAYPGICRVRRAGILRRRGALAEAEQEARRAADELSSFLTDVAGEAFYELGEIRLRMGDLPAAGKLFAEAHARGRDPQPGLAILRLAEGRSEAARAMIEQALAEPRLIALDRAKLLPAQVEISIACGDLTRATEGATELETITATYTAPALVAAAALARGRVELARGAAEPALVQLRTAGRLWAEIDLPVELAQTRLLLARAYSALGNADQAELEEQAAQSAMARSGAALHPTSPP
jgi:tRNA A-37 threonylcarbamoyl transferase component Bud32/tetratricopeptide (TPR) repeat protein